MHEADPHPVHHKFGRAPRNYGKPARNSLVTRIVRVGSEIRKISGNGVIDQLAEQCVVTACRWQLEVAEAGK